MIRHFHINESGTDYVVGDIHGSFGKLDRQLHDMGFDVEHDRLFSVGDLVDRGAESALVDQWVRKPWFFAVRGNHEDMAIRWPEGRMNAMNYAGNGGEWNISRPREEQIETADLLRNLPYVIEVDTEHGMVGIVHAECEFGDWNQLRAAADRGFTRAEREVLLWQRDRITAIDDSQIAGVAMVCVGHTPVRKPVLLGNVLYIDVGAWHPSRDVPFAILKLADVAKMGSGHDDK